MSKMKANRSDACTTFCLLMYIVTFWAQIALVIMGQTKWGIGNLFLNLISIMGFLYTILEKDKSKGSRILRYSFLAGGILIGISLVILLVMSIII